MVAANTDSLLSPKGVNYDVAALMAVKSKMKDQLHVLNGWDINSVYPCSWNMVAFSTEGFVVSLEMANMGLSGTLSPSIGNLSHLRTMLLQNNHLSGSIPPDIGKLSELQTLDISNNRFDGEIPGSMGYLTHLSYLGLSKNKLSGQIPKTVANLTDLSCLDLSFNHFSGPTPKILAKGYSITGNNLYLHSFISANLHRCFKTNRWYVVAKCQNSLAIVLKYIRMHLHGNLITDTCSFKKVINHHRWALSIVVGITCAFVVSVMLLVCWVHSYRSRLLFTSYVQTDYEFDISHLKRFSFREVQNATGKFTPKNIIGQGGFGVVYKGYLSNRTMVAVKRLKDPNYTGEVQFQTEVEVIGLALHQNLLRLHGYCMTSDERLLVYPYMPNGSVANRLRDTCQEKPWLLYLHEQCNPKIIHRDVRAANILLDESFDAVVGDFGLAKLLDQRDSHVTTAVRGTIGHITLEYLSTGQSSEKTCVFGFGILLLELITGQKALYAGNGQVQKGMILDWVRTLYEEKRLKVLADRDLRECFVALQLEKVVEDSQGGANLCEARACGFYRIYSDTHEESSFKIEAMELSGPR
ncbi:hypothetical protein I3760_09G070700 [Carya illinoinensis]|nr:hypothetical protein I3760_09G070700 [Carya illinoinensis]